MPQPVPISTTGPGADGGGEEAQGSAAVRADRSGAAHLRGIAPGREQGLVLGEELLDVGQGGLGAHDACLRWVSDLPVRQPSGTGRTRELAGRSGRSRYAGGMTVMRQ